MKKDPKEDPKEELPLPTFNFHGYILPIRCEADAALFESQPRKEAK